jgi:hypothetical protein
MRRILPVIQSEIVGVVRRRLSWVAGLWLISQLAVMTVTPAALCAGWAGAAAAGDNVTCTCTHGPDAQCPMHHKRATSPSGCNCGNNAPDPGSLTVVSLLGPVAVLPGASVALIEPPITRSPNHQITRFSVWIPVPPGPPPRA